MSPIHLMSYIKQAEERLRNAGTDNPALDARLLFGHALQLDRAQLLSQSERLLTVDEIASIDALILRRVRREPVGRIFGEREFWGLMFGLNEATLEPRPDSETLIEVALERLGDRRDLPLHLLDLGTGTGCLLLSLLHECSEATGLGIDLAPLAVSQASFNAAKLKLDYRAQFKSGNWFEGIDQTFDLIISNPPYINEDHIARLMPEVRNYDPLLALEGGVDGLAVYRLIIPQLSQHVNPNGLIVLEVGQHQAHIVAALLAESGFKDVAIHQDLGLIDRCVSASKTDKE